MGIDKDTNVVNGPQIFLRRERARGASASTMLVSARHFTQGWGLQKKTVQHTIKGRDKRTGRNGPCIYQYVPPTGGTRTCKERKEREEDEVCLRRVVRIEVLRGDHRKIGPTIYNENLYNNTRILQKKHIWSYFTIMVPRNSTF